MIHPPGHYPPVSPLRVALMLLVAAVAGASEYRDTEDFADATAAVEAYVQRLGAERVLLAVDIDNTLLAMNTPLGSDQWFEWQEYLLENERDSPLLVARDFDGLLAAQGLLFTLGRMHATQVDLPAHIGRVQSLGVKTLVLTSRGDQFRVATERELRANGYDFARSAMPAPKVPGGTYRPYSLKDPEAAGLTPEERDVFRLGAPKPVSYSAGVYMTAGQHKGAMLLTALHWQPDQFKAVVYIDDHERHVARVYDALSRRGLEVTALHYKYEDAKVKRFEYGDKEPVTHQWRLLDNTLHEVFD